MEKCLEILMVEDDPVEESRLKRELSKLGTSFRTHCVSHPTDFLRALDTLQPNLILADLSAAGLNGFRALDLAQERRPGLPVVFVASHCDQALLFESLQSGAAGCVYRQRIEELVPLIRQVLLERQPKPIPPPEPAGQPASSRPRPRPQRSAPQTSPLELCGTCRFVRTELGHWVPIERHLGEQGPAWICLATCPACATLHSKTI